MSTGRISSPAVWRFAVAVIGLLVCSWLMWNATQVGAARLLSKHGAGAGLIEPAEQAVSIGTADPESYAARATVLLNSGDALAAAKDFEKAIALRSRDYRLWMQLGNARDQAGETAGALAAFAEAVRLSPFYAHTHWQLGNLLLRAGRYDESFAELRLAAIGQPSFLPQVIDLTWGIYNGDAAAVEAVIDPQTSAARMALGVYFAQKGKGADAIRLFRESRNISDLKRQSLLTALLSAKQFPEAYEVWAGNHVAIAGERRNPPVAVIDGSFEHEIGLDDPGFGWQIKPDAQAVQFSLDSGTPSTGARSLLVNWNGNPQSSAIFSQLVLVEPLKTYQLSFDARTKNLVTAAAPVIAVMDASSHRTKLAQSTPLLREATNWQKFTLSFETAETTRAVLITLERQACTMDICPIFGQTWFDNFVLQ
jgi:hypothetical protein